MTMTLENLSTYRRMALQEIEELLTGPAGPADDAVEGFIRQFKGLSERPWHRLVYEGIFGERLTPAPTKTPTPLITAEQLERITGKDHASLVPHLEAAMRRFSIDTPLRVAHFLAQALHESGLNPAHVENLNYTTAERLMKVWPTRFRTVAEAQPYLRNPEKLANNVYANRLGNGPTKSGDGWRYRGRGILQETGRENYRLDGNILDIDLENNPELALRPEISCLVAGSYWQRRVTNRQADADDLEAVTRAINGGLIGLPNRRQWLERCKPVILS